MRSNISMESAKSANTEIGNSDVGKPELGKIDLKKTVHLPKTDFSMKANLGQLEPRLLAQWEESGLYNAIREARLGKPTYILHDGPPYANGNIHLGHALNKLLKDFIIKVKTMEGYDSPYVPGWDCHGLPIEHKVESELGSTRATMSAVEIRAACRKYAAKYVDLQRKDFIRLGVLGRWSDPYLTMSAEYEAVIAGAFVDFLEKGYVYKGLKPVNWCTYDRTALAEAEVEYENHTSPSIWVRFALTSDPAAVDPALKGKRVFGLIWTTTPWTIPANLAISFHPSYTYVAAETAGDVYIAAKDLLAQTALDCGWKDVEVVAEFPGARLEKTVFRHPFLERDSLGILGEHVTLEQGTGAVHTAPGHGQEDYVIGQTYGLPVYCPVDGAGKFFAAEGAAGKLPEELLRKTIWQANPLVIEILKSAGALLAEKNIEHSYPHCWRCHHPTIFRATEQWFIGMDRNNLRERALEAIKTVKWTPSWGQERISNMIATRPDWCISRQKLWGVPIIVFYCEGCQEPLTDRKILDRVVDQFRHNTVDIWYSQSAAELAGPDAKCGKCGGTSFRKETDILDVWFDSGVSHLAVLTPENSLPWPCDLYLEGGDQYRGWFHSSLLSGRRVKGRWLRTERPRPTAGTAHSMAKGARFRNRAVANGGLKDRQQVWRRRTAPVGRFHRLYRRRSAVEHDSGSLDRGVPQAAQHVPLRPGEPARFRSRKRLGARRGDVARKSTGGFWRAPKTLIRRCRGWYDTLEFHKVYRAIYDFTTADLSARYFDILKDRLYTAATSSRERRSGQTALYKVHYALVRLMAPLLAFTTEEVWSHTAKPAGAPASVHLTLLPEPGRMVASGLPAATRSPNGTG